MADRRPTTAPVGHAHRRRRLLVGTAVAVLATTACGSDEQDGPTARIIEEAPADGGVVADRTVDGVRVRVVVERDDLCLWVNTSPATDPAEMGGGGCGPLHLLDATLERDGASSTSTADDRAVVFAALVPDGYDAARGPDGRQWEIVDNLLVLVRSPAEVDAWPGEVGLVGEGPPRTIVVHDPAR